LGDLAAAERRVPQSTKWKVVVKCEEV